MTHPRRALRTIAVVLALGLGAAACSGEEGSPEEDGASTTGEAGESPATPGGESSGPAGESSAASSPGAGSYQVRAVGRGLTALVLVGEDRDDADESVTGRLIGGPGGCLALQPDGRPALLVLDDDAGLALAQDERPSVTVDDERLFVGQRVTVEATAVPQSSVTGIPQRCTRGPGPTVYLVD